MVLKPTTDVVFFPALLTLSPNEKRNLRIGVQVRPGAAEKSYRVFVQELPPLVKSGTEDGTVRVLTKMGIPIFLEPPGAKSAPAVGGLSLQGSTLKFEVKNGGTAHFRSQKVLVTAKAGSKVLHSQEVEGWYVLAGGVREYVVELPKAACQGLSSIQVDLESDKGAVKAALSNAHCGP
jgi:fimbrial chaperone protein